MEFSILGPTRVRSAGHELALGGPVPKALLAYLILHANRPVSTDELVQGLALVTSPASTRATVDHEIGELRLVIGADRLLDIGTDIQLVVDEDELDTAAFESDVEGARDALTTGDPIMASERIETALERWNGPALCDLRPSASAAAEADRLDELHLAAQELLLDAWLARRDLDQGMHQFESAAERHPDREGIWARYMVALYRQGRSADALAAYQRLRAQIGGDPSDWVVRTERAIVFRDPALLQPSAPYLMLPSRPALATSHRADVELPDSVVVTFLMTDVVGSTRMWERAPDVMRWALVRHDQVMIDAVESHQGIIIRERGEGDSTFSVFRRPTDAVAAAVAAQLAMANEPWPPECVITVRMALHTAEASPRDGDYYGRPVNRVARLRAISEPGQILASQPTAEIVMDYLPEGSLSPLGPRELKDMDRPEMVYVVVTQTPAIGEPDTTELDDSQLSGAADSGTPASVEPETSAMWELVIAADRAYFDSNGDVDVGAFPDATPQRAVGLVQTEMVVGRQSTGTSLIPDIDLGSSPEDAGVSRRHAILERQDDGRYAIIDAASTNGTYVNDLASPIPPGLRTILEAGDRIYLGNFTCLTIQRIDGGAFAAAG